MENERTFMSLVDVSTAFEEMGYGGMSVDAARAQAEYGDSFADMADPTETPKAKAQEVSTTQPRILAPSRNMDPKR